jgi:hypothetical protein
MSGPSTGVERRVVRSFLESGVVVVVMAVRQSPRAVTAWTRLSSAVTA